MCATAVINLPETIAEIESRFDEFERKSKREAAEIAFALARYYSEKKDKNKVKKFAFKSVELFEQCETDTFEQCGAIHSFIGGVVIPDLIHEGVVRFRAKTEWGIDIG